MMAPTAPRRDHGHMTDAGYLACEAVCLVVCLVAVAAVFVLMLTTPDVPLVLAVAAAAAAAGGAFRLLAWRARNTHNGGSS